ncbi:MAG: alpha/beta hydrolase [Oscillospiraceae bacterium]
MEYEQELVEKLLKRGEMLDVGGVAVECKPVPDGAPHALDPRQLRMELAMHAENANRKGPPPPLEVIREHMGGFNYNLNRKEIYTRYIEVPTSAGTVPVWGYYPRYGKKVRPSLVYVHGGAFFGGTPFTTENPCRLLAEKADAVVWNVDYGLAPEHPYPIPCTQVYEVVCYLHDHAAEFGMDPDRLTVAGDSAGGNLCAAAAQMDRDKGTHYIKAQVLLYAKLTFTNHELPGYERDEAAFEIVDEQKYLLPGMLRIGSDAANRGDAEVYVQGRYDLKTPCISPAFGECAGLPRTLFILAEYDGLRLEGEFYARKLQDAGVSVRVLRYCGVCHGFFDALGILPQSEAAVYEIASLLNEL